MTQPSPFLTTIDFQLSFPHGLPAGQSVCISSSRLGQKLENHDRWFDALRTLAVRLSPAEHFFVTAAGTTTEPFVRRLAELFEFSVVELMAQEKMAKQSISPPGNSILIYPAYFEPCESTTTLSVDDVLISVASQVHLLSVRKHGNIHRAAISRLKNRRLETSDTVTSSRTCLLVEETLTKPSVAQELIAAGAMSWWLYDSNDNSHETDDRSGSAGWSQPNVFGTKPDDSAAAPILNLNLIEIDRYLLHWTRRRVGPWPDQTDHEYFDDLIFQNQRRQHDAQSSLARILATRRILATQKLTRHNQPVVCFSNHSLNELSANKIFRQHLGRWDFLPFGIAVDRLTLAELGSRPVIYGNESVWENLNEADRPFYQPATSKNGRIDWTAEQEWRILGDLNLNQLPLDSVVVFVETETDAISISRLSRWPVVYLH